MKNATPKTMPVAAVLLAAGQSRRFGLLDKLAAPLAGRALGSFAAQALRLTDVAARYVVIGPEGTKFDAAGFTQIINPEPARGQASSLALGVAAARAGGARGCLIALADMPLVGTDHFAALLARFAAGAEIVASAPPGGRAMVPALFGRTHFAELETLTGDSGAKALLRRAEVLVCPRAMLADVDDPEALAAIAAILAKRS